MTRRDLRWRLAGAILLAAAGGSSLLNRHVAAGAGQPAPIETVLGLASFPLASLGILLLINGPRLRDKWRDECADVDRSARISDRAGVGGARRRMQIASVRPQIAGCVIGSACYPAGMSEKQGDIRVGIGGWTYEPWRGGVFYPDKLPHKRELEHAARQVTAIEINGTYYSGFKPETFAGWAKAVPDGFVFAVKASRYATNRKVLAEAGESIAKFLGQGLVELGDRLGPILWQFMATKKFDAEDFGAFLKLLPATQGGVKLRHAVQVRHESFAVPAFVAMAREARVAIVYADSADYPAIADLTADFVYARLENAEARFVAGYAPTALDRWADVAREWAEGGRPEGLPYVEDGAPETKPRDTFVFMINGAKERAPAAAMALIERRAGGITRPRRDASAHLGGGLAQRS